MSREFSFNNVNLYGSNVLKVFELIFWDGEKSLLTYLLRNNINTIFQISQLVIKSISSLLLTAVFLPEPQLVKMNNMSSDHRGGKTLRFFFDFNNQISLNCWLFETWGKQFRFYFWRYSVVACHKLSCLNSRVFILGFTWNCCSLQEGKKFSRNQGQSKCVTRETRYQVSRNSWCGISTAKVQN